MDKPECGCFTERPKVAEDMVLSTGVHLAEMLSPLMDASRLCASTHKYAMVTICALIAREFAEAELSHEPGTKDLGMEEYRKLSDVRTQEWCKVLADEVVERSIEIGAHIMKLGMESEREKAGGLQ